MNMNCPPSVYFAGATNAAGSHQILLAAELTAAILAPVTEPFGKQLTTHNRRRKMDEVDAREHLYQMAA
jgi:hypothetical protein